MFLTAFLLAVLCVICSTSFKCPSKSSAYTLKALAVRADNTYLDRMVQRKKIVVDNMLRRHQDPSDPLIMRMTYMASACKYNVTRSLKKPAFGKQNLHTMSVLADMKRTSPTVPDKRNIVEFSSAKQFAELLVLSNVDAFMINLDEYEYGGRFRDLKECSNRMKELRPDNPPACIAKDIFIHPIQVRVSLVHTAYLLCISLFSFFYGYRCYLLLLIRTYYLLIHH